MSPGLVTIDELILRSPNIRLTASGTVAFNGKLKLDSQLAINDKIRGQLFKAIRQNFQPINEPGYSAIDFQVGGTIDRPSTNLMDRLVGRDLSSMINSFFGGGKKERAKKKKKQIEEAAPATPEPGDAGNGCPARHPLLLHRRRRCLRLPRRQRPPRRHESDRRQRRRNPPGSSEAGCATNDGSCQSCYLFQFGRRRRRRARPRSFRGKRRTRN